LSLINVNLHETQKFINTQVRLSNNASERTSIKLLVVWYDHLSKRLVSAENHMAALLPFKVKARFSKGFYTICSRNLW